MWGRSFLGGGVRLPGVSVAHPAGLDVGSTGVSLLSLSRVNGELQSEGDEDRAEGAFEPPA